MLIFKNQMPLLWILWVLAVCNIRNAKLQKPGRHFDEPTIQYLESDCEALPTESNTLVNPDESLRFLPLDVFGAVAHVGDLIFEVVQSTREDRETAESFKQVFGSLSRNLQAITNIQETIDLLMTKSLDAIGNLDHKLDQSTAEIIADIDDVSKKVDRDFGYLLKVFKAVSETYTAVEKTRIEKHDEFRRMADILNASKVQSTITKLNNFLRYFVDEKARISQLSRQERLATLLEGNGFLQNLRESRTPRGDSLQTFLHEMTSQGYAIPQNSNDSVAFAALTSLYYGVQTHVSVTWYLMKVGIYLADDSYRNRETEKFNGQMENVLTDLEAFGSYLIGGAGNTGLIDQAIVIFTTVANLKFIGSTGENSSAQMLENIESLKQAKRQLQHATLPLITEIPDKLETQVKFDYRSLKTPLGFWKDGARVSYAVQYRQGDLYSRVGEWSDPLIIEGKANPHMLIPAHSTYSRLIFRRFNDETPQFVGIIDHGSESDFWDIDRDLYNAALGTDEDRAMHEANKLIEYGANLSAEFDLGRCSMHAAAMIGNTKLASSLLLKGDAITALDGNNYTPLHLAAENGWADFVQLMLQNGAQANVKTLSGSTPLHLAVSRGHLSAVKSLIGESKIDVNAEDGGGKSPLHQSVLNGVEDVVMILLSDSRTNVNAQSEGNYTPLHLSAMINAPEITTKLLNAQKNVPNVRCDGNLTAVHIAAIAGNIPALQRLAGTNLNALSVNGWTPLHYAVALQQTKAVSELLKCSDVIVDVLAAGKVTPLHIAAATDQSHVIGELLQRGSFIEQKTDEGLTALHLAAVHNNIDVVKVLIEKGANINTRTPNGSTILHLAAARSNQLTIKYILGETQAEVNVRNENLETPLDLAQQQGQADITELLKEKIFYFSNNLLDAARTGQLNTTMSLVKMGADLEYRNKDNQTALHLAAIHSHLDVIKYLLGKGASIDATDRYIYSALHHAALANNTDVVKYLIDSGSTINMRSFEGWTPLHISARYGKLAEVIYLVEKGATVNIRTDGRYTPYRLAEIHNHTYVTSYLKTHGGVKRLVIMDA